MIHIVVKDKNIIYNLSDGKGDDEIDMGALDIKSHGFIVVDEIVELLTPKITSIKDYQVVVEGATLESKMVARKLEDKLHCEVTYLENKE